MEIKPQIKERVQKKNQRYKDVPDRENLTNLTKLQQQQEETR